MLLVLRFELGKLDKSIFQNVISEIFDGIILDFFLEVMIET